jgi:hypothetical protein
VRPDSRKARSADRGAVHGSALEEQAGGALENEPGFGCPGVICQIRVNAGGLTRAFDACGCALLTKGSIPC